MYLITLTVGAPTNVHIKKYTLFKDSYDFFCVKLINLIISSWIIIKIYVTQYCSVDVILQGCNKFTVLSVVCELNQSHIELLVKFSLICIMFFYSKTI